MTGQSGMPSSLMKQTAAHDLESFVLVLAYTVFRKLRMATQGNSTQSALVEKSFKNAFGMHSVTRVLTARKTGYATSWAVDALDKNSPLHDVLKGVLSPALWWRSLDGQGGGR